MTTPNTPKHLVTRAPLDFDPKVVAGAAASLGAVLLLAFLTALTPDFFVGLGVWQGPVFAVVVALAGSISAYLKRGN